MIADLELRRKLITGTKVGPVCGYGYYRGAFDVWAEMKGFLDPLAASPEMLLGTELEEPLLLKTYPRLTGRRTEMCNKLQRHPTLTWLAVTPDAFAGSDRVVDAKVVNSFKRRDWGQTADDMPAAIQLQMLTQMGVCNRQYADVIALIGTEPRIYTMEMDWVWWKAVVDRLFQWYERYIEGTEMPPIDGSDSASRWLQQAFPEHKRPDLRDASDQEISLLHEYARLRNEQKALEKRRAHIENWLKMAIGGREGLAWIGGKFTWRRTKDIEYVDWQSMAIALRTHYVKDQKARDELDKQYTRTVAGTRRIRLDLFDEILEVKEADTHAIASTD